MIKILFAEDQTIVRRGIVRLLELTPDIRVVAEAGDGKEALDLIRKIRPDVALLDIRMPKQSGIEVLQELNRLGEAIPTVFLTTFDEDPLFFQAVQAGACGFLLKDVSLERLAETIRAVAAGETVLQPALTERVVRVVRRQGTDFETSPNPKRLTPRELDVLHLVAGGYSNQEIAISLRMSAGSVKNHVSSILSKLGARDRTRAVLRAIELGYL
jgi:DNA-binding NarL/FixJ family response regulator